MVHPFSKGQGAFIKIASLTVGLTVGLVLLAKVQLERSYDRCIVDKEHVYELQETFQRAGEELQQHSSTSGGIAPVLAQEIPEVVTATRYTAQFSEEKLTLEDGSRHYFEEAVFADSCFFDILATRTLVGDAKQILSTAGQCMISRRLSEKIGGEVVGQTFCFASAPQKPMTICGVYEDYPENSTFARFDILMSMPSVGTYAWDGTENLIGNDRYHSYVRLRPDADIDKVRGEVKELLQRILPWEDLKQTGYTDAGIELVSVAGSRMKDTTVRTTCIILAVVALVMLFTAVMNYILVVISSLVGRARQVAVRKVLGAPGREFYLGSTGEAALHLLTALALMALLLYAGQDLTRDLLGVSVQALFSRQTFAVLLTVCLLVLLCCGILPGFIYSRIPLTYAYRLYSESKRVWKLSLLAFQFVLSTMLLCVLTTIYRQYHFMLNTDMGYQYDKVAYVNVSALHGDSIYSLAREIENLPCVERTAAAYSLFCNRQSGDNVLVPGNPQELFNCANMFFAEGGLVETMGLQIVRGRDFERVNHQGWQPEMLVDEHFAQKMKEVAGIDDVIGQQFINSSLGNQYPLTVVGIVKDFTLGSLVSREERPIMIANGNVFTHYVMMKLQRVTPENITTVQQLCDRLYPDAELTVKLYSNEMADQYQETQRTRDLVMIGCIASLLITLIGLIGYVRDEVQRRSRELAIRKVIGATMSEVQLLFARSIAVIALPSIAVGVALGWYLSTLLMQQFAYKVALSWTVFALDALIIILIIAAVVFIQTRRVANDNPVEYLKKE
ncbi:MAG: ABC transporter permease [Bacteroidaceae bacterium]|nr:ABC transporter permease [Bacteroidaceae bacterium]